jgi:hypothetical protein
MMHDNWQRMTNFQNVLGPACLTLLAFVLMVCAGSMMPSQVFAKTENTEDIEPGRKMARQATKEKKLWITADHSKHELLKQEFTSGPEVTRTCLSCHNQAALQFHQTIHWTWMDPITEKSAKLGKGGLSINNF